MSYENLPKGQGKLLPDQHVALYRDDAGTLHAMTSVCPHRGCDVDWNDKDKVWDCPCHGSRFDARGAVLRGPALQPLAPAKVPE